LNADDGMPLMVVESRPGGTEERESTNRAYKRFLKNVGAIGGGKGGDQGKRG